MANPVRGYVIYNVMSVLGGQAVNLLTSMPGPRGAKVVMILGMCLFFGGKGSWMKPHGLILRLFQVGPLKKCTTYKVYIYIYVYVRICCFHVFFSESNVYVLKPVRCFSLNSFSYKGSYFKFRGEGSQIFWICLGGLPGRVPFDEVHGVTKDSLSIFHPAPKFVREYETNMLAHNPKCMYHPSCPVNIMHFYINFYVFFWLYFIFVYGLFLAQKYICRKKCICESVWSKQIAEIAGTFPFYLGSMLQV